MPEEINTKIEILQGLEPIRQRPHIYVDNTNGQGLHGLVIETVRKAIDPALMNVCTAHIVTIRSDGGLILADNGRGLPVAPSSRLDKRPIIEAVMTSLYAGKANRRTYQQFGFLLNLGPILNALAAELTVETIIDGNQYVLVCARGNIIQPLQNMGLTNEFGTRIYFIPDSIIWTERKFDLELLSDGLQQFAYEYPATTITLQAESLGKVITLKSQ